MPNHIHHHHAPSVTPTISLTASTYAPLLGSNDSCLYVVEPPRGRSFIWQIGVNSLIHERCQGDRDFLWSKVSQARQR